MHKRTATVALCLILGMWLQPQVVRGQEQDRAYIDIDTDKQVQLVITDPQGRRVGIDPRGVPDTLQESASSYEPREGIGTQTEDGYIPPEEEELYRRYINDETGEGDYAVKAFGVKPGFYNLAIHVAPLWPSEPFLDGFYGIAAEDSVATYHFSINRNADSTWVTYNKVVTWRTARSELQMMREQGLIDPALGTAFADSLNQARAQAAAGDSTAAEQTLSGLLDRIEAEETTLSEEAYEILHYNTKALKERQF